MANSLISSVEAEGLLESLGSLGTESWMGDCTHWVYIFESIHRLFFYKITTLNGGDTDDLLPLFRVHSRVVVVGPVQVQAQR